MPEPAAVVARLFMLHDVVSPDEARSALGDIAALRDGGILEDAPDGIGVASAFQLAVAAGAYCFGDRAGPSGDAVMPICGATLDLVRAVLPRSPVDAALDMGCGAGAVAILLARSSRRVVATDVSPRAVSFARLNAAINGVANVEFLCGDLFDSVRGERFDRVAAHPPFLARRAGARAVTFAHGGSRGDELSLRLIANAAAHLVKGGRAVVVADWPLVDGDTLDARLRSALGTAPADLLVLQSPSKDLDEYCAQYAASEHAQLDEAFARAAIGQRDHMEALGLRGIALAVVAIEQASASSAWTSLAAVRHLGDAPVTAEALDRIIATRRLAHGGADAMRRARLVFPAGATSVEQPMPDGSAPALVIHPPPGRPEWPVVLDADSAAIARRIARAPTVLDAARAAARATGTPPDVQWMRVHAVARDALLRGALDIA